MPQIIPAILAHTEEEFTSKLELIRTLKTFFQIDVVDGEFATPATFYDLARLKFLASKNLGGFEIDLMATHPLSVVDAWMQTGAERFIFHVEAKDDPQLVLQAAKRYHKEVGMSLNPETPWEILEPYLAALDVVLFLGVHPGASGQTFIPAVLEKIRTFHDSYPAMPIEVDGGVTLENAAELIAAGASRLAVSSAIFKQNDHVKAFKELQALCPTSTTTRQKF